MFKDLYKKANDKIPTDDAYLRVMEKVNTKSGKSKYSYGKIAVLAACFLLTFSMISVYEKFAPKEDVPFEIITPENLPTDSPKTERIVPENKPIVASIEETAEPVMEDVASTEAIETSEPLEETEISDVTDPVTENSFVKNPGIPEDIGTGTARFTLGETVSKDTYYEYLGKNIEESLVLPAGFVNETPDSHNLCLTENENFDDRWTFYFTQGTNSIFITTTKNTQNVLNLLANEEFEKSNFSGIPALIFEEDLQKLACIEVGGISYTLSSYGVSDEDFENLIISLAK